MKRTNIYLPAQLEKRLKIEAEKTGESKASVVRVAVTQYLDDIDLKEMAAESKRRLKVGGKTYSSEEVDKMFKEEGIE